MCQYYSFKVFILVYRGRRFRNTKLNNLKKETFMSSENRTSVPNSLNEHWMPFTSNKDFKANPRLITEAKGVYLKTHHGKTQIDASSGLFCNPLGFSMMCL